MILILFLVLIPQFVQSANILFYFGISPDSHRIAAWPLVTSLADLGHNVTFLSSFPPKPSHVHPKVMEFFPTTEHLHAIVQQRDALRKALISTRYNYGRLRVVALTSTVLPNRGSDICRFFLSAPSTQEWIQTSMFDLIVIDGFFNECGFGQAHVFRSKVILFGTSSIFSWWHDAFGFPAESSWLSERHLSFPTPMTFAQRVVSTLTPILQYQYKVWFYYPRLEGLFRQYLKFEPEAPSLAEMEKRTSLVLLSTHYSEEFARSLPPLIVPVGGIHLAFTENTHEELPPDIAAFLDESGPNGFIYVSFGSLAIFSEAPAQVHEVFFRAFNSSQIRFLLKWEGKRPEGLGPNVLTSNWLPQLVVLGHSQIKAFITHAGLMGIIEAISATVPLIMLPIFAEQDFNAFRSEAFGRGILLDISTVTSEQLAKAIIDVTTKPKYKLNMVKTRTLYQDRPLSPLATALWWTEYVLRHDDLSCLKPLSINQPWFQTRLLDVWGAICIAIFVTLYVVTKLVLLLCKKCFRMCCQKRLHKLKSL